MKNEYTSPITELSVMKIESNLLVGSIEGNVSGPVGTSQQNLDLEWNDDTNIHEGIDM